MNSDILRVLKPLQTACTPPASCYRSMDWFEREKDAVFRSAWHFICLGTSLEAAGQYVTRSILGMSVLVARNGDGALRAFINVCRHRGAPLVCEDNGTAKAFVCSYHGWAYDVDGCLLRAPGLGASRELAADRALVKLPVTERQNMVFVNLDRGIASPEDHINRYMGDYFDRIAAPHAVSSMRCVRTRNYVVQANWKLYVEVDMETLHTPYVHGSSIGEQAVAPLHSEQEWIGVIHRSRGTPALRPNERQHAFPPAREAYGAGLEGTHFVVVLPGFFVITAPDCMWWIHKTPLSPDRTAVNVGYCFPKETLSSPEYAGRAKYYFARWDQVIHEDDRIVEHQQRGLVDGIQGCYADAESVVHEFDKRIVEKVLGRV
ncbi:aromatic ring-hydroxylating oxygenase subunit alpha [Bordetella genomosp. 9]|uniref:Rieske domain-containing protein n=1 Tax=Bordetella genomosp. 9 TaxID=1416803 RepID=A0A1W6Z4P1_9BORD|nr:aromatic ring-hydroxylating dioxygenase subunit alpha [Bordetella genomosp. 9]ARP88327.1 hypothetical protein CAL13_20495 [Bordetella genomosp. 9]